MPTRTRTHNRMQSDAPIDQTYQVPYNAVLCSIKVQWENVPVTSEDFQVWRIAAGIQDFLLAACNPADQSLISYGNTDRHEILLGDGIRVLFPNTDGNDVTVELIFEQT